MGSVRSGLAPLPCQNDGRQRSQDQLAPGSVASILVEIYRSLSGGWELRTSHDTVELIPGDEEQSLPREV